MAMSTVEEAVAAIGRLGMVVVVDDAEGREGRGYLVMAAEAATPETIAFFGAHTAGVVRVPGRAGQPGEAAVASVGTGLDATEGAADAASVDLVRAAGLAPAGMLGRIVGEDRARAARRDELESFAERHGLPVVAAGDVVGWRPRAGKRVRRVSGARIPTVGGDWRAVVYESLPGGEQHLALVKGDVGPDMLVRVHSECLTGDVFGSLRCDCGPQLRAAIERIDGEGRGIVVYLRGHEGRGIGLGHKIDAYRLQEQGHDTVDANVALGLPVDTREYGVGAQMLVDLGATTVRLMTNNPAKYAGLERFGLGIAERIPLESSPNPENLAYLRTKRERMGHLLGHLDGAV